MESFKNFTLVEIQQKYASWLGQCDLGSIKPYLYLRSDFRLEQMGKNHSVDWFPWTPLLIDPWKLENLEFADQLLHLENTAFGPQSMPIPREVFYDCGVMPGLAAGFAIHRSKAPSAVLSVMKPARDFEWIPLSMFIVIPSYISGEWVAHSLSAINSLLPSEERFYGLGFLSKAFGLWAGNILTCCGMTQWGSPSLKLHSQYGDLQILTSYTPVHRHSHTMTYRCRVDSSQWSRFFDKKQPLGFLEKYKALTLELDPKSEDSMKDLQRSISAGGGPYFLSGQDIAIKKLTDPLQLFTSRT